MIRAASPSVRAGRFEHDLLAIVDKEDRAVPGLVRSKAGSIGIGGAIILAGLGVGLSTTGSQQDRSVPVHVPRVAAPVREVSASRVPSPRMPGRDLESLVGIASPSTHMTTKSLFLVRPSAGRHATHSESVSLIGIETRASGTRKLPFAGPKPLAAGLMRMTSGTGTGTGTGTVANNAFVRQERSDESAPSKQAVIATRDALRDLRLR